MLAPAQGVPNQFSIKGECQDHPWFSPCNPVSAYNLVSDNIPGGSEWWNAASSIVPYPPSGYPGAADLRAACDDFVRAGLTVVGGANSTDCGDVALASLGTSTPASYPHLDNRGEQVMFSILRASNSFRGQITRIIGDGLNFLFGTPNFGQTFPTLSPQCTVLFRGRGSCAITNCPFQCFFAPFFDGPVSAGGLGPSFWQLYVGGFTLASTPDHLYGLGNSLFSGSYCAGPPESFPNDYFIYCDPEFDTLTSAGEFTSSLAQSDQFFARAAAVGADHGFDVPIYSGIDTFVELNGWNFQQCNGSPCANTQSSIVNTNGFGTESPFWTLLNSRQVPGYSPSNPIYTPGGGDPNTVRMGFSQGTQSLSPFQYATIWEANIVFELFDSMLAVNPLTGAGDAQLMDWQTISHSSSFNPSEVSCNALTGCVTGTTTQIWHLRNDLKFQDGNPVTANDVAYSIIA
ncbi:MAG TPA: hypothetical protein VFV92_03345, partial [Candidatus Bathyarchaeia archaeon]|nr:hypothetical protein [Candidatus Bathyarchaeia archaeon]